MKLKSLLVAATVASCICTGVDAHSPIENERTGNLVRLVDKSNLIFVGQARQVVYRNAQGGKGEGVIPYTIVTYQIGEVLRGKAPGKEITMRFVGGPDGRGRFLTVSGVPVIQEGDQDVLFVASTSDPSCPLVYCERGRFRVLDEHMFDTFGSPVLSVAKGKVLSRGMPPSALRALRFPTPTFDELVQNPEVAEQLKSENISMEDARRRYEEAAPKAIELQEEFPVQEAATDSLEPTSAVAALPLSQFVAMTRAVSKRSKRKPVEVRSLDPDAKIVPAKLSVAAPKQIQAPTAPTRARTRADSSEYEALEKNGFDPVMHR